MRQEIDLMALRGSIQLDGSRKDFQRLMPHVEKFAQAYRGIVRDDLVQERSALSLIVDRTPTVRPTSYYLVEYLERTRRMFLEEKGISALGSDNPNMKVIGAIALDMNTGFTNEISPLMTTHDSVFEATAHIDEVRREAENLVRSSGGGRRELAQANLVVQKMAEEWNRWRQLFSIDPRGFSLLADSLVQLKRQKDTEGVKIFEDAGAQLAYDVYLGIYDQVDAKVTEALSKRKK